MKTRAKTIVSILTLAACAFALQKAQANQESYSDGSFTVVSTVTEINPTDYTYSYAVTLPSADTINSFTVNGPSLGGGSYATTMDTAGITSYVEPSGWNDGSAAGGTFVTWDTTLNDLISGDGTFEFTSPIPPIEGAAYAQDGSTWGPVEVYIPGAVPDGGLTMTLLGGTLLGLGALRRRFAR